MNLSDHERYRDMAAAYALGALDPEERDELKAHLQTCADCERLLGELSQTVAALPLAVPQVTPPPGLRERVMNAIAQDAEPTVARTPSGHGFGRGRYLLAASIAVLALGAAAFAGWAIGPRDDGRANDLLARSYDALSVMARADQRWTVRTTDAAPGGWGVVAYDSRAGETSVVMWGLDDSPGVEYRLWVTDDGERQRLGRLYAADGGFWAVVSWDMTAVDGIGVSAADPSGGSRDVVDAPIAQ